jgi:hypothetical protein
MLSIDKWPSNKKRTRERNFTHNFTFLLSLTTENSLEENIDTIFPNIVVTDVKIVKYRGG